MVWVSLVFNTSVAEKRKNSSYNDKFKWHKLIVDKFYQSRKSWRLSKLGTVLFKNEPFPIISKEKRNKLFIIVIWKVWTRVINRHIFNFGPFLHEPLEECSVTNCAFTGDGTKLKSADAIIFNFHMERFETPSLPYRHPRQRWIFWSDESPKHVFNNSKRNISLSEISNIFNWSMTYSSDADIPVPYGRTVALKEPRYPISLPPLDILIPHWKMKIKDVLVGILISNCNISQARMDLIKALQKYIPVNVHGYCGKNELRDSCPGHFSTDCEIMSKYMFYLAFENSKCREYMTEKIFHHSYSRGAIPIIYGPSREECKEFLPPNSYLHVDNYARLQDLANDIVTISGNNSKLYYYHKWRNHFKVVNEHGYFGKKSFHLCRVCEALNYNDDKKSVYSSDNLRHFLDSTILCRK